MTCLRSPRVAELRFDPSHLCFFSTIFRALPAPAFSSRWRCVTLGHLTLGRGSGAVVRGPTGRGVWLVAGALAPTPLSAVLSLGSV